MKKIFIFAVLAAPLFFSCAKEMEKALEQEPEKTPVANVAFKASIESLNSPTKADINASNQLVWAAGDKIGIFVNDDWVDKNKSFTLVGAGGSTTGGFTYDGGEFSATTATVAYFPWNGTNTTTDNNVYEGTMYFKLPQGYYGYTSGKMLTPLVAKLSRTGEEYDNIEFKHVGAAVKVKINNLPAYSKSIGLSVDGKQIRGDWHINPANAGTDAMSLDAAENTALNDVWLNFDPIAAERSYTFLFPVPTLPASSKLSFDIYDKNDIKVWSAGARTKGDVALGRAEVLEMPALSITAYSGYDQKSAWGICGTHNSWGDTPMVCEVDGNVHIANDITFEANAEFKIRKNGDWAQGEYGWSNIDGTDGLAKGANDNIIVLNAGTYDIILNTSTHKVKVVLSDLDYPDAGTMPHHTSIKKATNLGASETANCYVITAPGNYKIPAVKGNSATSVGTIDGVELLWETYNTTTSVTPNSVIAAVDWDEIDNGYVYFKTPDVLQPGNALIAAKNGSDIIWSWHIWIPEDEIQTIGKISVSTKYLMDRNIGALTATAGDNGKNYGMLYQWGRPHPKIGLDGTKTKTWAKMSPSGAITSLSTSDGDKTMLDAIQNPTVFFTNNHCWYDDSAVAEEYWSTTKTIYDPCPAGWTVPAHYVINTSSKVVDDVNGGVTISTVYFPGTGSLSRYGGTWVEDNCFVWSCDTYPSSNKQRAYWYLLNDASAAGFDVKEYKTTTAPVRCVKIEGEVLPAGANGVTLATDGSISSDWASADAISDSHGGIKEWKYGYDSSNLYFYFKIARSSIKSQKDALSFRKRRYIWMGFDTNNNPSEGVAPGHDLTLPGCEAVALVYPFTGTATALDSTEGTLEIINGLDDRSQTEIVSPSSSTTEDNIYVYGNVTGDTSSDFAYIEMSVPRAGLGISSSFTGIMKVQFSLSGDTTAAASIELK